MATFSVNKISLSIFLFVLLLAACKLDRRKEVDRKRFSFKAYTDTRTFFQNIRMYYYDREVIPNSEVVAFRLKARSRDSLNFKLHPTIVLNQANNDALLFLESVQPADSVSVSIGQETFVLTDRNREKVLEFATILYEAIMAEKEIYIQPSLQPLLSDEEEKENFRKVMSDYYRLTRIF